MQGMLGPMSAVTAPVRPARSRGARRGLRASCLLLSAALALCACSGDDDGTEKRSSQEKSKGATLSRTSPLTGKVLPKQPGQPILAIKVDNSGSAQQIGVRKADMVVEELVEGGTTRLATFFYSSLPPVVGPVRSMRTSDVGIVSPLKAVLVASGAAAPTWKVIRKAKIKTVTEGGRGFYRGAGAAPYNLLMDVTKLTKPMKPLGSVPEPYLPFGDAALPRGKPAKNFTAVFSPAADSVFAYRGGTYVNTDSYAREGGDFRSDTVLVLRVKTRYAGYKDPAGFPVPETVFSGRGPATVFHGGRRIGATWVKKGLEAPLTLRGKGGDLSLPPGTVRIELVPRDGGSVRIG